MSESVNQEMLTALQAVVHQLDASRSGFKIVIYPDVEPYAIRLAKAAIARAEAELAGESCEHGIQDGEWCRPCNAEYKRAEREFIEAGTGCELSGDSALSHADFVPVKSGSRG